MLVRREIEVPTCSLILCIVIVRPVWAALRIASGGGIEISKTSRIGVNKGSLSRQHLQL